MKKTIPILALCIFTGFSITRAGDAEQAEQRFREALINYKQNATLGADSESVSFDLNLLRQAVTAAHEYQRTSQSSDSCTRQLIEPTEELKEAVSALYFSLVDRNMANSATLLQHATAVADQAAAKYQRALSAWETAIAACPQAVNPYLLQGTNP